MDEITKADTLQSSRLLKRLEELDWDQAELKHRSGISQQTINKIARGQTKESRTVIKIAEAMGLNPHWLATGKGSKERRRVGGLDEELVLETFVFVQEFLAGAVGKRTPKQKYKMFMAAYNGLDTGGRERSREDWKNALLALINAFNEKSNGEPE